MDIQFFSRTPSSSSSFSTDRFERALSFSLFFSRSRAHTHTHTLSLSLSLWQQEEEKTGRGGLFVTSQKQGDKITHERSSYKTKPMRCRVWASLAASARLSFFFPSFSLVIVVAQKKRLFHQSRHVQRRKAIWGPYGIHTRNRKGSQRDDVAKIAFSFFKTLKPTYLFRVFQCVEKPQHLLEKNLKERTT